MSFLSKILLVASWGLKGLRFLVAFADWKNLVPTLKYAWLTVKHKWFVLLIGRKFGCSWRRMLTHDLSKLSLAELPHYGRQFFGSKDDPEGFARCWLHHQNRNDHHPEYWVPRSGHSRCDPPCPDNEPLAMPVPACQEMIADWAAAGRAYAGKWPSSQDWPWLESNWGKLRMHVNTRALVIRLLSLNFGGVAAKLAAVELLREMSESDAGGAVR